MSINGKQCCAGDMGTRIHGMPVLYECLFSRLYGTFSSLSDSHANYDLVESKKEYVSKSYNMITGHIAACFALPIYSYYSSSLLLLVDNS